MILYSNFIEKMNFYGENGIKFFFIVDFEMKFPVIMELSETRDSCVKYFIDGASNYTGYAHNITDKNEFKIQKNPVPFEVYKKAFNNIIKHEKAGNSYLVNLTFKSRRRFYRYISINLSGRCLHPCF